MRIGRRFGSRASVPRLSRRDPIQRIGCGPWSSVVTRSPTASSSIRRGPSGVVIEARTCCGSARSVKMGEDITEMLGVIPGSGRSCRPSARSSPARTARRSASRRHHFIRRLGVGRVPIVLFEKFSQHQPLNPQAERYTKEGVVISLSTLADKVGSPRRRIAVDPRSVPRPYPRRWMIACGRHHRTDSGQDLLDLRLRESYLYGIDGKGV